MQYLKYGLHHYDSNGEPVNFVEIAGLSTDSKPTAGLCSGSKLFEVDTGKAFVLDAESDSAAWHEIIVTTAAASK